jgi:hypothetical protein
MRVVVEIHHTGDGVEGEVRMEAGTVSRPFSSWLDLLRLLEQPDPQQPPWHRPPVPDRSSAAIRTDIDQLAATNERIGTAESNGDVGYLDSMLAPVLAFRRSSGVCIDRQHFLDDIAPGPPRTTRVESVELLDHDRAVVRCVVEMSDSTQHGAYDNLRLFVRVDGDWRLLGWANAERRS